MVDGKLKIEDSPEGRLAALFVILSHEMEDNHLRTGTGPSKPDVADLRDRIKPYVWREIFFFCIKEATALKILKEDRVQELVKQFYMCETQIPREHRL